MGQTKSIEETDVERSNPSQLPTTRTGSEVAKAEVSRSEVSKAMAERPARMRGNTYIDDEVVSVIARIAAEQVPGVHQIGESNLRNVLSRFRRHHGVEAEVGLHEAAADIEIIAEYGYPMREVAQDVRERIIEAIESMTGRHVIEVNVFVIDVYVPKSAGGQRRRRELE